MHISTGGCPKKNTFIWDMLYILWLSDGWPLCDSLIAEEGIVFYLI